jgi:hypothetical protein
MPSASYSDIVTGGMIMNLDAGSRLSYSGSGTTWTDISGNGNTGTLTNGPTYSSANSGSIVFDDVDDYVPTLLNVNPYNVFSISLWVYAPLTGAEEYIIGTCSSYGFENGFFLSFYPYPSYVNSIRLNCFIGNGSNPYSSNSTSTGIFNQGGWNFIYFEFNGKTTNSVHKIVVNNTYTQNITLTNNFSTHDKNISIGGIVGNVWSGYGATKVGSAQVYNRALSTTEISQNFNALRNRYGI